MTSFLLYGHGGSYNHGAEAIVRTTIQMIRKKYPSAHIALSSHFPEQDREFDLAVDEIVGPDTAAWKLERKALGYKEKLDMSRKMYAGAISSIDRNTVCLSVGGDNFCYDNWHRLAVFQEQAMKTGAKTILWGCSVEPSSITPVMLDVLQSYSVIVARESITYNALSKRSTENKLVLAPDPAFALEPENFSFPAKITSKLTIGINISPLSIRRESKPGILMENIRRLIQFIITQTEYSILLIPHVFMPADNDFALLSELLSELPKDAKRRTSLIDGHQSAAEYKRAISRCAMVVCARTHISIAAYSLGIPALVLGYSVKARGIAHDLGMADCVLDLMEIAEKNSLTQLFVYMHDNLNDLTARLKQSIPIYMKNLNKLFDVL